MNRIVSVFLFLIVMLSLVEPSIADIITIDGTVKSVDVKKRTITVESGSTTRTFDISTKVQVAVNGDDSSLSALKPGHRVALNYHDQLEIVVKISALTDSATTKEQPPELHELSELNQNNRAGFPWVSGDGLRIFWEEDGAIWTAHRRDQDSLFREKTSLFQGRHPTLSSDGLQMVLLKDGVLHSTSRESINDEFRRPGVVSEFKTVVNPKNPCLSPDGLSLYFNRKADGRDGSEFAMSTRTGIQSPWQSPQVVQVRRTGGTEAGNLTWIFVTVDRLTLFCAHEQNEKATTMGNLMIWRRKTDSEPFTEHHYLTFPELGPCSGRSPRYCETTNELFFSRFAGEKQFRLCVIKHFFPDRFR